MIKGIRQTRKFNSIFTFLLICLIFSSILFIQSKSDHKSFSVTEQDSMIVEGFNKFRKSKDSTNIFSQQENYSIYFEVDPISAGGKESYKLDFREFGNVSDCEIYLETTVTCFELSDFGGFYLELISNYNPSTKNYTDYEFKIAEMSIQKDDFTNNLIWYEFYFPNQTRSFTRDFFSYDEGSNSKINLYILKIGDYVTCKFLNSQNESLFSVNDVESGYFFANVRELRLGTFGVGYSQFSTNLTKFTSFLEFEYRDVPYLILKNRNYRALTNLAYFLGILGILIMIVFGFGLLMNSETRKERIIKQNMKSWNLKNQQEKKSILKELVYEGEIEKNAICGICKLPFKKKKNVLRCPQCQSLFHDDHLYNWLKEKHSCPVCKMPFENLE